MRSIRFSRRVALVLAAGALSAVSVAYASGSDETAPITACYSRTNGLLRVVDAPAEGCRAVEVPIDWNRTGPRGPAGAPGNDGAPGASEAFAVTHLVGAGEVELSGAFARIASVAVPAGDYVANASLYVVNDSAERLISVYCVLHIGDENAQGVQAVPPTQASALAMTAVAHLSEPGSASLYCKRVSFGDVGKLAAETFTLVATRVGALHAVSG